jgi:2-oxoisovalerate dehydrogenase E1 component
MDGSTPPDLDDLEVALLEGFERLGPPTGDTTPPREPPDPDLALQVYAAQVHSRHLDHAARWLRAQGAGFYTIGSAGHEANAWVAAALRPTDPALLHYRSGGFYLARAAQVPGHDGVRDILLGLLASVDEPIAGGRHKVFGHPALTIIPQTSTIASHLPRAVGVAFAIGRSARLGLTDACRWPADALAVCSFGDASLNHASAQAAINTAAYTAHQGIRLPLLFVCEDNGWGISVPSPSGWVEASLSTRPGLRYERADGTDPVGVLEAATALAAHVRDRGLPAVLHLRTVRFGGHAGTDVEAAYRSAASVRADRSLDPILATAGVLVRGRLMTPADLRDHYLRTRADVRRRASDLIGSPTLQTPEQIMAPLSPRRPRLVALQATRSAGNELRRAALGRLPEEEGPLTLAESINRTLADVLLEDQRVLVFGEDVGVKGGVYGVTRGLHKRVGGARVFDSLLDETSILGLALGTAVSGMVPIPEIQYLAYLHNAEDQLRGEAASLSFFSNGQYRNGMVVRIAGYGYQKGFGGHFHNDNAVAVLRDIPGLVIASPARAADAAPMLRTCVAAAVSDGTVSVVLEPIALYHTRDLHLAGDEVWTSPYEPPERWADNHVAIGDAAVARDGTDVLVVSWANGLYLSLRVAERLAAEGVSCRVLDLRWLAPLPSATVAQHAAAVGRVVVVDETRRSGGVGEAVVAGLVEHGFRGPIVRVAAEDSFVPLGDAARVVLVSEDDITAAVRSVLP